ncbi:MAG: hypothetical protein WCX88_03880, partial [Patescibacteria group bacterium]
MEQRILGQEELKAIYEAQKAKNWSVIQNNQLNLKATMVQSYEDNWQKYIKDHTFVKAVFDFENDVAQEVL